MLASATPTLKQLVREGRVKVYRTATNRWRIPYSEVERVLGIKREAKEARAIIYARVSSPEKKGDLERQIQYLMQYCSAKGYRVVDVLSDVTSELNANRRGLMKLFDYIVNR